MMTEGVPPLHNGVGACAPPADRHGRVEERVRREVAVEAEADHLVFRDPEPSGETAGVPGFDGVALSVVEGDRRDLGPQLVG